MNELLFYNVASLLLPSDLKEALHILISKCMLVVKFHS